MGRVKKLNPNKLTKKQIDVLREVRDGRYFPPKHAIYTVLCLIEMGLIEAQGEGRDRKLEMTFYGDRRLFEVEHSDRFGKCDPYTLTPRELSVLGSVVSRATGHFDPEWFKGYVTCLLRLEKIGLLRRAGDREDGAVSFTPTSEGFRYWYDRKVKDMI